jgi:hypothetical protein
MPKGLSPQPPILTADRQWGGYIPAGDGLAFPDVGPAAGNRQGELQHILAKL